MLFSVDAKSLTSTNPRRSVLKKCSTFMTMPYFIVEPMIGNVNRIKTIYGCLHKHKCGSVRFRTIELCLSAMNDAYYD